MSVENNNDNCNDNCDDIVEFIKNTVCLLVSKPESVNIIKQVGQKTIVITIDADREDFGKIIGKHGKVVNAIRELAQSISASKNKRVKIDVLD